MLFPRLLPFSLFATVFIITGFTTFAFGATLVQDEVDTLKEVGKTLGTEWDFTLDPCSNTSGWLILPDSNVTCDCNFFTIINGTNTSVCHVTAIVLKRQSLQGFLPVEIVNLPYLQVLDLTRNYLSGSIPPEWGSTKLVSISLIGNRLNGSIPKEIGNISTLSSLTLEYNQLSGLLPPELGNLSNLQRLFLDSNYFSGELPSTFAKLTNLTDFRIADNQFTGKIPNFIQNWTKLEKLVIQASGMDGPIPSEFPLLANITELIISDLNGAEATSPFPQLSNMKKLEYLILRNCNIIGPLPDYLKDMDMNMDTLKILDLSFNKLNGTIPSNYDSLYNVDYIYLTGNLLTGEIPDWILDKGGRIDLSYNNLTSEAPVTDCHKKEVNLFRNSSWGNNSEIAPCLSDSDCPKKFYSFHINCGGEEVMIGTTKYEGDTDGAGPSFFFKSRSNWAISSTGHFLDDDRPTDNYIRTINTSILSLNTSQPSTTQLYMNARISPISLTYYGFCLGNGNYTVSLHFAEILFTNDKTYRNLGRRVFDIYIQGIPEQKDFNIADEALGAGKQLTKNFTAVVNDSTLEIRFQWAGKGTTSMPDKGIYGPLISAISVNPDFIPPENHSISAGAVVGIVTAVAIVILLVLGILWWKGCLRREELDNELRGLDLQTGLFTLRQIKAATNNFDIANKIGEGGFGPVYKGLLSDGVIIAVKQLSSKSKQGNREFVNEIGMISALQHPHLVKLYGCCIEGNQLLLIYEYMENNSLARALFGPEESQLRLDWPTRHKICVGIARGLAYLHEESRLKIVHRDIKATNVLLDKNLDPKISDFGLAKLDEEDNTHISTRIAGTYGYMAPEYAMRGYLTDKADVYSFGIVALEIASGKSNTSFKSRSSPFYLLDWAKSSI